MEAPERLLRLLTLLSARAWWSGAELVERLEVTPRTLRRDITRLRLLGYPVDAIPGRYGGYALGQGGRLPPLVLDDDEAVAVAIALRAAAGSAASGLEDAALAALVKLDQVLPARLRERVAALRAVTVDLRGVELPRADGDALVAVALACRRRERLRFTYRTAADVATDRLVEPYRLVSTQRRWYLVAFDTGRRDWRTFRVDRISELTNVGGRFTHHDPPDAAALVAEGVAVAAHPLQARVRLHLPAERAAQLVGPTIGVLEPESEGTTIARIGGDAAWIAHYLAGLECTFEILDPPEVRAELRRLAQRLLRVARTARAPALAPAGATARR